MLIKHRSAPYPSEEDAKNALDYMLGLTAMRGEIEKSGKGWHTLTIHKARTESGSITLLDNQTIEED